MRRGTILGRVAREGGCKETHAEAGMEQEVGHADISLLPTMLRPHPSHQPTMEFQVSMPLPLVSLLHLLKLNPSVPSLNITSSVKPS